MPDTTPTDEADEVIVLKAGEPTSLQYDWPFRLRGDGSWTLMPSTGRPTISGEKTEGWRCSAVLTAREAHRGRNFTLVLAVSDERHRSHRQTFKVTCT